MMLKLTENNVFYKIKINFRGNRELRLSPKKQKCLINFYMIFCLLITAQILFNEKLYFLKKLQPYIFYFALFYFEYLKYLLFSK